MRSRAARRDRPGAGASRRADRAERPIVGVFREPPDDGAVDDGRAADAPALEDGDDAPALGDLRAAVAEDPQERLDRALPAVLGTDRGPLLEHDDLAARPRASTSAAVAPPAPLPMTT